MAAELVRRRVSLIVATGGAQAPLAAKTATTTIPIVFPGGRPGQAWPGRQPARPDGNVTGVNILAAELTAKRLELLHELVPGAVRVAVLVNPDDPSADVTLRDLEAAGRALDCKSQFSMPAPVTRSMQPSQLSSTSGQTHFLSAAMGSS